VIALMRAEVRRVLARRLVRVTVVLAFVAITIGGVIAFVNTEHISQATVEQRAAVAQAKRRAAEEQAQACVKAQGFDVNSSATRDEIPRRVLEKCAPDFISARDHRFHRTRMKGVLQGVTGVLVIVAWALGASLIGAEFASRGITTQLTWETRRTRVFVAKALVAVAASAVLAVLVLGFTTIAMLPSLIWHGAPAAGEPAVRTLLATAARGTALAAIGGGIGFAIATVGRNTAAALGAGFGYIIILENILGNSIANWRRWLLLGNFLVFLSGQNGGGVDVPGRTVTQAGLFLTAVAVALLVGAAATFRTRDVQ
jgi:ABC-2 type transport system permease protein